MTTSPKHVRIGDATPWVSLSDGRTIAAPVQLSKNGLHWNALDEDISVAGLLAGQADVSHRGLRQPA
jgi:hypothetical protein